MPTAVDVQVARIFHAQHHVISRAQARAAGCTPRMIDRRLGSGAWVAVATGVYRTTGAPASFRSDLMAACLDLDGVASHTAAAALHGLGGAPAEAVVVTVPAGARPRCRLAQVHESSLLPPAHTTVVDAIPATTVARTLVDLASVVRPARLGRIVDDALVRGLVRFDEVDDAFGVLARRGRPGIAAMRRLLADRGPGVVVPESELEARLLALLDAHDVDPPVRQAAIPWPSAPGRVDLAWPAARLVVEADGRRWHARFERFDADRARDRAAVLGGWRVLRFTWADVVRAPEVVVDEVRRALRLPAA